MKKLGEEEIYDLFVDSFEALPIAACVNDSYLCMHGGISKELVKLSDINNIDRFQEPQLEGFLCDLLWADPHEDDVANTSGYTSNTERECSIKFGYEPIKKLLKENNILSVIRAHQVQDSGYKFHKWSGEANFPSVITVFSAPKYARAYNNKGAVILLENDKMNIKQFKNVSAPFYLPEHQDLFEFSLPYLSEKIHDMLENFRKQINNLELTDTESSLSQGELI